MYVFKNIKSSYVYFLLIAFYYVCHTFYGDTKWIDAYTDHSPTPWMSHKKPFLSDSDLTGQRYHAQDSLENFNTHFLSYKKSIIMLSSRLDNGLTDVDDIIDWETDNQNDQDNDDPNNSKEPYKTRRKIYQPHQDLPEIELIDIL